SRVLHSFCSSSHPHPRYLLSFPTRRSSDLGQGNAKHTPCIDIDRFIYFPRLPNRSMPINNPLVTMVILGPVSANRTAIRMKFPCRIPVKDKGFHFFICSSDQGCFDSGMRDDCLNLRKYKIQWSMVI